MYCSVYEKLDLFINVKQQQQTSIYKSLRKKLTPRKQREGERQGGTSQNMKYKMPIIMGEKKFSMASN